MHNFRQLNGFSAENSDCSKKVGDLFEHRLFLGNFHIHEGKKTHTQLLYNPFSLKLQFDDQNTDLMLWLVSDSYTLGA